MMQRTPDNLYPQENELNAIPWDCADFPQFNYGGESPSAQIFHNTDVPSWHPFLSLFWNGTCDEGQLTHEGLIDSTAHGKVRSPDQCRSSFSGPCAGN